MVCLLFFIPSHRTQLYVAEFPLDPKTVAFDPFRLYPQIEMRKIPSSMPMEYRQRIRTLLPYVDLNAAVDGLSLASKDASGEFSNFQPVQNRPWEWTENLGDQVFPDSRVDDKISDPRNPIKNVASIPLELFSAKRPESESSNETPLMMTPG